MNTIQEIIEMPGVEFCGMIQTYDVSSVKSCWICIMICLPIFIVSIYAILKTSYENAGLFAFLLTGCILVTALITLPFLYSDEHIYVQLRVLHDSNAAFRIIEEFEDVKIESSTFTIRLDK